MNQKHYSYTIYTKRRKKVDLTPTLIRALNQSHFTNGIINITAPYPECTILIEEQRGGRAGRDMGVSLTLPFFNLKLVTPTLKVVLIDHSNTSTRRKIHLTLIGE
ncbi:hypothetical protein B9Q04_15630 [Candidatus Marsarchaeota G2 archaeon BE_D]|uniref:Uncharacterized protein n=5 Tax=Candidatus Marsarchaeota group 2 TaxID=2203771 RepID=A0A2R6C703_9ARCH|nr:MAG: hypothetical protein B9Q08_00950 [Candidatus Marsarchaeota G2 archaeon ECH_B_SAG-M15]PSN96469.1 MAG: hypothetical protein B9Q06_02225 [Candidatus Marsarchaeota G2 archaeon ECH_B_2]PSO01138.1 MAG: hypothetical protein B9Q07_01570 [Candidatus Marsarchaeota G2 archaeon ECH_B_3]PSO02976.1 MAG: hypothetical protein B9Q05_02695 [Candidatus Marsarchaeota G2 archaeon ECH_B_1]PSO06516.1 MAG: hypothetical protein B9Q04_15630 [Candidatus Marsarchaeota G2 archaeon BE_D]